jgi:hypothetical protein
MRHLFLTKHSNGRKHSKAAVVKFLGNHNIESFLSLGLQAKRIESDVAGEVVIEKARSECIIAEISQGLENTEYKMRNRARQIKLPFVMSVDIETPQRVLTYCSDFPTFNSTENFRSADAERQKSEKSGSNLLNLRKMSISWSEDDTSKERVEIFPDKISKGGEHGNAAVGNLRLTVPLDLLDRDVLGSFVRIELAHRSTGTRKSSTELGWIGNPTVHFGIHLWSVRSGICHAERSCSIRTGIGRKGGGESHHGCESSYGSGDLHGARSVGLLRRIAMRSYGTERIVVKDPLYFGFL